jgi:hypothetical protein
MAADKAKRPKIDWEAIERDYRTGSFTLRELEAKHGASYAQICRRAKAEGWQKDLRAVVRQATNAALLLETATNAQQAATDVVQANVELNKQVILRQRADIRTHQQLAMEMLAELRLTTHSPAELEALCRMASSGLSGDDAQAVMQSLQDLLRLPVRVQSMQKLADVLVKLQTLENKAFSLNDSDEPPQAAPADAASAAEQYRWLSQQKA